MNSEVFWSLQNRGNNSFHVTFPEDLVPLALSEGKWESVRKLKQSSSTHGNGSCAYQQHHKCNEHSWVWRLYYKKKVQLPIGVLEAFISLANLWKCLVFPLWDIEIKASSDNQQFVFVFLRKGLLLSRVILMTPTAIGWSKMSVWCIHNGSGSVYFLMAVKGEQYEVKMAPGQKEKMSSPKIRLQSDSNKSFCERDENLWACVCF